MMLFKFLTQIVDTFSGFSSSSTFIGLYNCFGNSGLKTSTKSATLLAFWLSRALATLYLDAASTPVNIYLYVFTYLPK